MPEAQTRLELAFNLWGKCPTNSKAMSQIDLNSVDWDVKPQSINHENVDLICLLGWSMKTVLIEFYNDTTDSRFYCFFLSWLNTKLHKN